MKLQRGQFSISPELRASEGATGVHRELNSRLAAGGDDRPLFRLNLMRALQLHRRLALGIALAGLILALAYGVILWPVYTAKSQVYVQPVQSKVMAQGNEQTGSINSAAYDSYVQQQVQSASNPDVLVNALHKLGPGAWQRSNEIEQVAAERLGRSIEVARVGTSYEVAITARAADQGLAARIANAVANSIVERASGEGNAGDDQRIAVLREERDRIQNELKSDYTEQDDLNKQLGMAAVGTTTPDLIDDQIARTREELIKAQTDHDQAEARFTAMKAGQGSSSPAIDAEADDQIAADAGLASMKTSLNQRRAVLITQMANLTPTDPAYKQNAMELAKINGELDAMMKDLRANAATRIQQKLRTDLERTAGVEAQLKGQLRELAHAAASATPKLQRLNDLATDIVRLRARYAAVDEQLHNFLLEDSVPGAVHLSVAAVPPLHPAMSGILKKALPLALGGLILGLLAASIVNKLDPRVYIASDIEQVLGSAPMAVLPDFDEVSDGVAAEHLLRLASAIEHARKRGVLQNCIFTGTSPGVGVTTLATRVTNILTAMGRPAVLLDSARIQNGILHPSPAISSLTRTLDESATQRGSRPSALLKQVANQTEQQESLVITDTAPLAISAETEYLVRSVDSVIVVIQSGVTTRAQLLAAVSILQRLEVGTVGFVLNRVTLAKADLDFRRSIYDLERHLRTQGTSASFQSVVPRQFVDEPSQESEQTLVEVADNVDVAQAVRQQAPEAVDRYSSLAVPDWTSPAPLQASQPQVSPTKGPEVPWWLLEKPAQQAATPSQPEKPRVEEHSLPETPSPQPNPLPAWYSDAVPSGSGDSAYPTAGEGQKAGEEKNPFEDESRLNGLKGLIFSMGLKRLNQARQAAPDAESSLALESEQESAASAHAPIAKPAQPSSAAQAKISGPSAPAKEVTTQPEFLSPREYVPVKDRKSGSAAHDDRWDSDEEMHILPSRRGQYKRND